MSTLFEKMSKPFSLQYLEVKGKKDVRFTDIGKSLGPLEKKIDRCETTGLSNTIFWVTSKSHFWGPKIEKP